MPQTIMIGANDPNITYLLQRYAEESGFQTAHVCHGNEVLEVAHRLQPSLIILDIDLGKTTSRETLRRLKAEPATSHIPVVLYSCVDEPPEDWVAGADGYLVKSVMYDDFLAVLKQAQAPRARREQSRLQAQRNSKNVKMATVRRERPGDEEQVHEVNYRAFGRKQEAEVVDVLRRSCPEGVSLVAEQDGRILGHILFTPATIEDERKMLVGAGLGPVAVLPEHQGKGIGSMLIRAGLEEMKKAGQPFVILVGHPNYYPRFGFEKASKYGIRCEYEMVPDEAFMIIVFDEEKIQGIKGIGRERPEFAAAM